MLTRSRGLALLVATAVLLALGACSSAGNSQPAGGASGYQRMGGAAQGISVEVPASWVLVSQDQNAASMHSVMAVDAPAGRTNGQSPHSIQAFCMPSPFKVAGQASLPFLRTENQMVIGTAATHLARHETTIGGVPGMDFTYQRQAAGASAVSYVWQLTVLPKAGTMCYITLNSDSAQQPGYLAAVAGSARFS